MRTNFIIGNSKDVLIVPVADVLMIQACHNNSVIFLTDGSEEVVSCQLGTIATMLEAQLDPMVVSVFMKVGRSEIINLKYLFALKYCTKTKKTKVVMRAGKVRQEFSPSEESIKKLKNFIDKIKNYSFDE